MTDKKCPVCNADISTLDAVCPSCGFKLLGTTQEFNPVSMEGMAAPEAANENAAEQPQKECPDTRLTVVRGPQTGVSFQLSCMPLSVGRNPKCDIFLNDMTVSREHARIEPDGDGFKILDNNSYNGIWINNESVEEAHLHDGDIIQIGAFCLAVSC